MTSSPEVVDLNGNIFGRTICPLSFLVIALIFSELIAGGGGPQDQKKGDVAAVVRSSTISPLNNRTNKRNKGRGVKTIELLQYI